MHVHRLLLTGMVAFAPVLIGPLAAPAAATPAPSGAPYPRPARCVDAAGALGPAACPRVVDVLQADERASTDEIAVAVVQSTGGVPVETWATGLFNAWGLGKRDRNNGVLLVVPTADRRLRIVTGTGLATRLPDRTAGEIVDGTITPLLAAGRTREAVLAGLDAIRRALGVGDAGTAHPAVAVAIYVT